MNAMTRRGEAIGKRPLAILLALALLAPGLMAKGKRGAEIYVSRRDGKVVQGELLAVKGTDLIIMDGSNAAGVTESLADVEYIDKVGKKSKWLTGMVIGIVSGTLIGAAVSPKNIDPNADDVAVDKGGGAFVGAIGFGLLGAYIGSTIKDKAVKVERTDPDYLAGIAAKLKKWARDPG